MHLGTRVVTDSTLRVCLFVVLAWIRSPSKQHTLSLHNPVHIIWWKYKYLLDYPFFCRVLHEFMNIWTSPTKQFCKPWLKFNLHLNSFNYNFNLNWSLNLNFCNLSLTLAFWIWNSNFYLRVWIPENSKVPAEINLSEIICCFVVSWAAFSEGLERLNSRWG